ncbi:MAG: M1 family metallopeptidase [Candidatus Hermodarchaeota archaeon]
MPNINSKFPALVLIILLFLGFNCVLNIEKIAITTTDNVSENHKNKFGVTYNQKLASNGGEFSRYNLSLIFDDSASSVTGNLTVNYYNNDPLNFTRIPFHLFLSDMQYHSRQGSIEILNVTTMNEPKSHLNFEVDEIAQLLWVTLESEINPNNRTLFNIEFTSIIPDGGIDRSNSYGSGNNRIYKFACFYPMPCVYDKYDGWNTDPYLADGDPFYYDMAYYNIFIEAPKDFVIAATGQLIEKQNKILTNVYHFDPLYPVREITFSASKGFNKESTLINGVNVSTYYLPNSEFLWQVNALNFSKQAFTLFNDTFGEYPYPTLNIVEEYTHFGGMEYPCQVYISASAVNLSNPSLFLEKVIVHEIGHQWWYNLVGNDEVDCGFLDEGLACWSTDYYAEVFYNNWEYFQSSPYIDLVRIYHMTNGLPAKINSSVYECIDIGMDYWYIAYYKCPLIFEKLRKTIGSSYFLDGLRQFFSNNMFQIAFLTDLQQAMEIISGFSLNWFFLPWFDNFYLPKYSGNYKFLNNNQTSISITIKDLNEPLNSYAYSQQVQFIIEDNHEIIFNGWIWINSTTTIELSFNSKPVKVKLEYSDEVIVQLNSPYNTYLYLHLEEIPSISGSNISQIIFCLIIIIFLLKNYSIRRRIKCRS